MHISLQRIYHVARLQLLMVRAVAHLPRSNLKVHVVLRDHGTELVGVERGHVLHDALSSLLFFQLLGWGRPDEREDHWNEEERVKQAKDDDAEPELEEHLEEVAAGANSQDRDGDGGDDGAVKDA